MMDNVIAAQFSRMWAWLTTKTCTTCGHTKPNKAFISRNVFMTATETTCWSCYMARRREVEAKNAELLKNSRIAEHLRDYEEKLEAFRKFKEQQEAPANYRVPVDSTTQEFLDLEEQSLANTSPAQRKNSSSRT